MLFIATFLKAVLLFVSVISYPVPAATIPSAPRRVLSKQWACRAARAYSHDAECQARLGWTWHPRLQTTIGATCIRIVRPTSPQIASRLPTWRMGATRDPVRLACRPHLPPSGKHVRHPYRNPGTGPRQRGAAHAAPGRPAGPALAARPPAIRPGCLLPSLRATRPTSRAAASSRPGRHKGCRAAVGHVAGRHRAGFRERLSRRGAGNMVASSVRPTRLADRGGQGNGK